MKDVVEESEGRFNFVKFEECSYLYNMTTTLGDIEVAKILFRE